MKREDFMKYAEREIENAFRGQRNRMMNLVEQAWAEGKKNAEINGVKSIVESVIEEMGLKKVENAVDPDIVYSDSVSNIPAPCRNCSNHPSNGGSGNCNCVLGSMGTVTTSVT